MTTQATPDYNAALADARKATETAQALADDYRRQVDGLRIALDAAHHALLQAKREALTIRERRDGLMSHLGEAIQTIMVKEGL